MVCRVSIVLGLLMATFLSAASAQTPGVDYADLIGRLEAQEQEIRWLKERLDQQFLPAGQHLVGYEFGDPSSGSKVGTRRLPVVVEQPYCGKDCVSGDIDHFALQFYCDYDKGFVVRPYDTEKYPFDLKFNGRIQFRHHGFARDVDTWQDNAGVVRNVRNRNAFDIERARLYLRGTVLDPRVSFFLHLDGDSDGGHLVDFFDYWWGYQVTDSMQIQMGKRKVPGSRQWLLGAFDSMFVDRALVTDFFRPDRTLGIWAMGDVGERMHYQLMIGNGYRTANLPLSQQNDQFAFAATQWVDLGEEAFGTTLADFECHSTPAARIGHSFTTSSQMDNNNGIPLDEADFVRLTDGTVLTDPNALAPGTRVSEFDIYTYTIDAALKYRGWSVNGEYFCRWLEQIAGTGAIPITQLYDRGFFVQTSVFLVPQTVYVAGRVSQVDGLFGNHYEYAAAVNWFLKDDRSIKLTFDVTRLEGSPLNNTATDILVGDDGMLFRTQFQARF